MFRRIYDWFDKYDLPLICLFTLILSMIIGAVIGKVVISKYESKLNLIEQQYAILQEHIEECIDSELCEHYKVIY